MLQLIISYLVTLGHPSYYWTVVFIFCAFSPVLKVAAYLCLKLILDLKKKKSLDGYWKNCWCLRSNVHRKSFCSLRFQWHLLIKRRKAEWNERWFWNQTRVPDSPVSMYVTELSTHPLWASVSFCVKWGDCSRGPWKAVSAFTLHHPIRSARNEAPSRKHLSLDGK